MALGSGVRLGAYEILDAIGEGGMGQVYRARDTRLDRIVAIKVLPEEFAKDPTRRERFEREARAVAALNHPHICQLYDVGEAAGPSSAAGPQRFLVMEFLEGQSLEERIVAGPLPIAESLSIASDLADALDHAHRRGLVHRDLKPANVMLTKAGAGSAGARTPSCSTSAFRACRRPPTCRRWRPSPRTARRSPPMARCWAPIPTWRPSNCEGREADARSDIFAFGAVLYEMVTGRRAFQGTTAATLIGAILHSDPPPLASRQPLAPPALERVVSRCLAKDPDNRWQTARDLALELRWIAEHPAASAGAVERRWTWPRLLTVAAALAALAIAGAAASGAFLRAEREAPATIRLPLGPPEGVAADAFSTIGPMIVSPDGRRIVYTSAGPGGRQMLWVRPLDSFEARPIADTDGGAYPFWSPDSRSIGFFAQGKLKRVQVDGGPAQILCDARETRGGSWSVNNVILFSAGAGNELYRVPAGSGVVTALPADGVNQERNQPSFLPDGIHYVYAGRPQRFGVFLGSLDSPAVTLLLDGYSAAAYVAPGYLLLLRGATPTAQTMTLLAQRFDPAARELAGSPEPLADRISFDTLQGLGYYSASDNGTLVYGNATWSVMRLTWLDRSGVLLGHAGPAGMFSQPALSRDGSTIAVQRTDPDTQAVDLWSIDAASALATRLTEVHFSGMPIWSPDGTRMVYFSARNSPPNLYLKTLAAAGAEQRLFESSVVNHPTDWSRDGRFVVYATLHATNGWDLMRLPMDGPEAERRPTPYLATTFNEHFGRVSPDGRWLAYMSDESSAREVYVQSFPTPGAKLRISTAGGTEPVWRADGSELYYVAPDGTLMAVPVTTGATLRRGTSVPVFKASFSQKIARNIQFEPTYAVSPDGKRFLINTVSEEIASAPTKIVFNWPSALPRNLPVGSGQ